MASADAHQSNVTATSGPPSAMLPREAALAAGLGKADFKRVADARRQIWTGGFAGFATGGAVGYLASSFYTRGKKLLPTARRGQVVAATLMAASACSFLGAMWAGQGISELWDVWDRASQPRPYEAKRREAIQQEQEQQVQARAAAPAKRVASTTMTQGRPAGGVASLSSSQEHGQDGVEYSSDPYATRPTGQGQRGR